MFNLGRKAPTISSGERQRLDVRTPASDLTSQPNPLEHRIPALKDLLSPGGFDRSRTDLLRVGNLWARTVSVTGLPSEVSVGWLHPLLSYEGHLDLSIHVDPYDERSALHYLTLLITKLKARLRFVAHLQGISDDIVRAVQDAERIRDLVASNTSRLFRLTVLASTYHHDEGGLHDAVATTEGRLAGRRIYAKGLDARQDEGYQSVLPFGLNYCDDLARNLDSGAMGTLLPFTDADLYHLGGYQFGVNIRTAAPIIYSPYDPSLNNHNIVCYAASGSGKSATIKTHIGRSIFTGERTAVLDPEGEYRLAAEVLDGAWVPLGPNSPHRLNPFDVREEEDPDTAAVSVHLGPKVLDLMALISTMVGGLSPQEAAVVEMSLRKLYEAFGVTANPENLYESGAAEDPDNPGVIRYGRRRKKMPQLRDLARVLQEQPAAGRVAESLGPYVGDGVLSFFDCQSNVEVDNQWLVVFDLSQLDEGLGKPVALQVVLTWLWEQFVKREARQKKRVVVDEAWLMADYEPAMQFLENVVRRARKRSAGLTVISQDFRKFALHPRGQAIHSNSSTFMFLRAEESDVDAIQETFKLSDGEMQFISTCGKGEGILRVKGRAIAFRVMHTPFEQTWVYTTPLQDGGQGS